jgi:sugar phosphate isomerase/epimerase
LKLSVSNIGWSAEHDEQVYEFLSNMGFAGLEIAPTRIFKESPYDNLKAAESFARDLKRRYDLTISSMQSIWYGRRERLFGTLEERLTLAEYTRKAIDFAVVTGCKNLVFGNPKNRIIDSDEQLPIAIAFFRELGQYASEKGIVVAIEPNPSIYGTNFINRTEEAVAFARTVGSPGIMVNVDFGTIIHNNEDLKPVFDNIGLVSHIHISEPSLVRLEKREKHKRLAEALNRQGYSRFVSVEMRDLDDLASLKSVIGYAKEVFA